MNKDANMNVTVVLPAETDLHLLEAVLDKVNGRDAQITIQFEQPKDLQSQISDWLIAVYGRPA
jgi:hypothetical protein